jgi:type I restriction enzyme, S subunit
MGLKSGYKQTEVGVIPDDWSVTTVGDEFSIQLGKMLDNEKNIGVPKPYLGNRAVQWRRVDLNAIGVVKMTPSDLQRFRLREGDLLVCEGGEIGRATIWGQPLQECYYQKALHRLRPTRGYNVTLMLSMLEQWASTGFLLNFVTQTSIAHLPKDKFEKVPLPLPPTKAEQESIAEALSDADGLIKSVEQLIAKKHRLKEGAAQELLSGKKRVPGFSEPWEAKSFGEIFDYHSTATNPRSDLSEDDDTYYIHYGDIHTRFKGHLDLRRDRPPRIDRHRCKNATLLQNGDWIMVDASEDFDGIGKSVEVMNLDEGVLAVSGLHTFLLREKCPTFAPGFKGHLSSLKSLHDQFLRVATGIKVYGVPKTALRDLVLNVPRVPEQNAIASILSDMDAEIAALEAKLAKTRHIKQGMMQNLLTGSIRLI